MNTMDIMEMKSFLSDAGFHSRSSSSSSSSINTIGLRSLSSSYELNMDTKTGPDTFADQLPFSRFPSLASISSKTILNDSIPDVKMTLSDAWWNSRSSRSEQGSVSYENDDSSDLFHNVLLQTNGILGCDLILSDGIDNLREKNVYQRNDSDVQSSIHPGLYEQHSFQRSRAVSPEDKISHLHHKNNDLVSYNDNTNDLINRILVQTNSTPSGDFMASNGIRSLNEKINYHPSNDWRLSLSNSMIDIQSFRNEFGNNRAISPKLQTKYDYDAIYQNAFEITPKPAHEETPETTTTKSSNKSAKRKNTIRKGKRPPSQKIYVQPTSSSVLFGRGTRSRLHPGNQEFRKRINEIKDEYCNAATKEEKEQITWRFVRKWTFGNFVVPDKDGQWYVATDDQVRYKVSQALRDGR